MISQRISGWRGGIIATSLSQIAMTRIRSVTLSGKSISIDAGLAATTGMSPEAAIDEMVIVTGTAGTAIVPGTATAKKTVAHTIVIKTAAATVTGTLIGTETMVATETATAAVTKIPITETMAVTEIGTTIVNVMAENAIMIEIENGTVIEAVAGTETAIVMWTAMEAATATDGTEMEAATETGMYVIATEMEAATGTMGETEIGMEVESATVTRATDVTMTGTGMEAETAIDTIAMIASRGRMATVTSETMTIFSLVAKLQRSPVAQHQPRPLPSKPTSTQASSQLRQPPPRSQPRPPAGICWTWPISSPRQLRRPLRRHLPHTLRRQQPPVCPLRRPSRHQRRCLGFRLLRAGRRRLQTPFLGSPPRGPRLASLMVVRRLMRRPCQARPCLVAACPAQRCRLHQCQLCRRWDQIQACQHRWCPAALFRLCH